jgi:hypothetical protein
MSRSCIRSLRRAILGGGGDAQRLWSGGATGAVLDLLLDVRESRRYRVELQLTRAPDYARLKAEVEGQASTQARAR